MSQKEQLEDLKATLSEARNAWYDLDEDFKVLQTQRDDLATRIMLQKSQLEFVTNQLESLQHRFDKLLARFPQSAEGALIFPGTLVFKMVLNSDGIWDPEEHLVTMGAESLNMTQTKLSECYVHPQMGIDAMEGR